MQLSSFEKNNLSLVLRHSENLINFWENSKKLENSAPILPSIIIAEDCPTQARMIEMAIEKIIKRIERKRNVIFPEYVVFKVQTIELADMLIKNQIKYDKLLLSIFDIHLSDGLSLELISKIPSDIPVIALSADQESLRKTKEMPNVWQCIIKGSQGMIDVNSQEYKDVEDIIAFSLATKISTNL